MIFILLSLTETILEEIRGRGFSVTGLKETVLSREMAEEFYKEHREKPFFSQLVEFMCRLVCPYTQPQEQGKKMTADLFRFHCKFYLHFKLQCLKLRHHAASGQWH